MSDGFSGEGTRKEGKALRELEEGCDKKLSTSCTRKELSEAIDKKLKAKKCAKDETDKAKASI